MNQLDDKARKTISFCAQYGEAARTLANKLLSTSSTEQDLDIENSNILSEVRSLAEKHKFNLPTESEDKNKLINVLLKLIIDLNSNQANLIDKIFESPSDLEHDDESFLDREAQDIDLRTSEIKEKFSRYLVANKFSDILAHYDNEEQWKALKPTYRRIYASMLIDEANANNVNYPEFWSNYI